MLIFSTVIRESYALSSSLSTTATNNNVASTTTATKGVTTVKESFPSSRIRLNGVEHYIRDTGDPSDGSPIAVLLHGLAGSTDSWEDVAPLLFDGGVRAIAIDRVGFGRSERPKAPPFLPLEPPLLPSFLRESVASAIESLPTPPTTLLPDFVSDILPPPNKALATAVRRPSLLSPKMPWSRSKYKIDPYSSEFAVSALWPLLQEKLSSSSSDDRRKIYFVGHSAGGPIALQAFLSALEEGDGLLSRAGVPAGVALVAPAVLDPQEDPGIYEYEESKETMADNNMKDEEQSDKTSTQKNNNNLRLAVFKSVLSLPDAFVVPIVRRIYDGRNITEALLDQTSSSRNSSDALSVERTNYLANKYVSPVREYPNEWDVGLLNVYRADLLTNDDDDGKRRRRRGRDLLSTVREKAAMTRKITGNSNTQQRPTFCVISGDDDRVVPAKASKRVAEILDTTSTTTTTTYVEIQGAGHLPMDETPKEMAEILLNFMR